MEKKKILIVDDERTFTDIVKLTLETTGKYEVRAENSGRRGIKTAKDFLPDIIVLDVIMPDIGGGTVASLLKEDPKTKDTPILFLTAVVTDPEVDSRGGSIGGYPFIAKPVSMEKLVQAIENIL